MRPNLPPGNYTLAKGLPVLGYPRSLISACGSGVSVNLSRPPTRRMGEVGVSTGCVCSGGGSKSLFASMVTCTSGWIAYGVTKKGVLKHQLQAESSAAPQSVQGQGRRQEHPPSPFFRNQSEIVILLKQTASSLFFSFSSA